MPQEPISQEQFLRLLMRSEREMLRYVMALVPNVADAQEIVQDAAVALWQRFDKYDSSQPFTPWACRFAANKARDFLRKHRRWRGFLKEDLALALLNRREEIAQELDQRVGSLQTCLEDLPRNQRLLVEKYYFDQSPVELISQELGRSEAALYKGLQRIRVLLMECMAAKFVAQKVST